MRLQNKVIIVTGSTTGIGKAIAMKCVEEGACVVIHGLEKDWGEALVAEIGNDKAVLHIEDITAEGVAQITAIYPTNIDQHIKASLESALMNSQYVVPK